MTFFCMILIYNLTLLYEGAKTLTRSEDLNGKRS